MVFKATDGAKVSKFCVSLDEETVRIAREVGGGNLSLGMRVLAQQHNTAVSKVSRAPAVSPRLVKLRELGLVERDGAYYFTDGSRPGLSFLRKHGL